jgi:PAS domain S-box-containing protein
LKLKCLQIDPGGPSADFDDLSSGSGGTLLAARLLAVLLILLGIVTLIGGFLNPPLFHSVSINAGVCLLLSGSGLFMSSYRSGLWGGICGGLTALVGLATLLEYALGVDFGFDHLMEELSRSDGSELPGRMSPHAALGFGLAGVSLFLANMKSFSKGSFWIIGTLGATTAVLGVLAVMAQVFSLETTTGWGNYTDMAALHSWGIMGLGLGLSSLAHSVLRENGTAGCFPPIILGMLGFLLSGCLWLGLVNHQEAKIRKEIQTKADSYRAILEVRLNDQANALIRMARRWEETGRPDSKKWTTDAANYVNHFQGYYAIGWADSNYKLQWVVPGNQTESVLESALEQKTIHFSQAVDWVPNRQLTLSLIPLFPQGKFDGTLIAAFAANRLLTILADQPGIEDFHFFLSEKGKALTQIAQFDSGTAPNQIFSDIHEIRKLTLNGLDWQFNLQPLNRFLMERQSLLPESVFGMGILLSILTGWMLNVVRKTESQRKILENEILQRKQIERDLARAQKISKIGNWTIDLPDQEMWWSDEVYRILDLPINSKAQTLEHFLKSVYPEDYPQVKKDIRNALSKGVAFNITHRVVQPSGTIRMVKQRTEIYLGDNGKPSQVFGTIQDITEQKNAENLAARLGRIVDKSFNEIYIFDSDSLMFTQVNLGARLNLGYRMEDLCQMTPLDLKPEFTKEQFEKQIAPLRDGTESVIIFETVHKRKNGTMYPVEIRLQLSQEETPPQFVAIIQDISERKKAQKLFSSAFKELEKRIEARTFDLAKLNKNLQAEIIERKKVEEELIVARDEAEKANQAKSQFLSQMSHELRTPLNAILGFSQLIATNSAEPLTSSQEQGVNEILKGGKHLLDLINEILDMARIETGNLSLSIEDINLNDLAEELLALNYPMARNKQVELYNYVSLEGDLYVRADRVRLKQIMLNLMSNAIKYNKSKGSVKLDAVEKEDGMIEISVSDTGHGISEENMKDLFKPFNRFGSEQDDIEGTGIGLTITRKLVECMDGTIDVKSIEGEGSIFVINIPKGSKELAAEDMFLEPVRKKTPNGGQKSKYIILYVEDNPANLNLVRHLFRRRSDVELLAAPDAKLGIELAQAHQPDLVLMDINLPGMDGITAMKYLQNSPETQSIPVVAISANAMPRDVKQGLDAGFCDYLTKPLDVVEFHRVVGEILKGARTQ